MRSSWAQHDTVVAARSREAVRDLFVEAGEARDLDGSRPVLLSDPASAWFVERGAIDLFFVDVRAGSAAGRRRHFVRIAQGELVLGLEPPRDGGVGLLAVAVDGTRIAAIDQETLRARALRKGCLEAVCGLVDTWVRRLGRGIGPDAVPARIREAEPGETIELAAGSCVRAGPKTVWVEPVEGEVSLVGGSPVAPRAHLVPLTRETWIEAATPAKVRVLDAATYFRSDPGWESLQPYHRLVLEVLDHHREAALEAEAAELEAREELEARTVQAALHGLASVTEPEEHAGEPSLLAACRRVGELYGYEIAAPIPGPDRAVRVSDVARASRIRERLVILKEGWWRSSGSPKIAFLRGSRAPVALLPRPLGGYDLFDPATRSTRRADEASAEALEPWAHELYRPLPARPLGLRDLAAFAFAGNGVDLTLVLLAGALVGLFGMAVPFATGEVIDAIIPAAEVRTLLEVGAILLSVSAATTLVQLVRGAAALRVETRTGTAVQAAVWDRLLRLPVEFFRRYSAGDLANRANGIEEIRRGLSGSTLSTLLTGLFSLMNFAFMLVYDARLALVGLVLAAVGVLAATGVSVAKLLVQRRLADSEGRLSSLVLQVLQGVTKLKVAGAERRAFGVWSRAFMKKRVLTVRARALDDAMRVFNASYPALMLLVLFYFAAGQPHGAEGGIGTGRFLAFFASFGVFSEGLLSLVAQSAAIAALVPLWERARPILEAAPEVDEHKAHPGELRGAIQVSHVCFRYSPDGPPVLDDVDFEVAPGELVAIVGASAAGKSTLLRVMLGFEEPESGGVFYDRQSLATLDVAEVRRQLGVVLQNGQPIAGDIFENIVGARNLSLDQAMEAAAAAGLAEDIAAMPMGIRTVIGQGGHSLSGGQRQRLLIARAIVMKPRIVFFDEATSALDNRAQEVVTESIARLQATRVVIAHRLSTIAKADKIIVLDHGRVVEVGTYEELMANEGGPFHTIARRQLA